MSVLSVPRWRCHERDHQPPTLDMDREMTASGDACLRQPLSAHAYLWNGAARPVSIGDSQSAQLLLRRHQASFLPYLSTTGEIEATGPRRGARRLSRIPVAVLPLCALWRFATSSPVTGSEAPLPLPLQELPRQLSVGHLGRSLQTGDGWADLVLKHAFNRRQNVGCYVVWLPSLLALREVGRSGKTVVDRYQGVRDGEQLVPDLPEGGLRPCDRPGVGHVAEAMSALSVLSTGHNSTQVAYCHDREEEAGTHGRQDDCHRAGAGANRGLSTPRREEGAQDGGGRAGGRRLRNHARSAAAVLEDRGLSESNDAGKGRDVDGGRSG